MCFPSLSIRPLSGGGSHRSSSFTEKRNKFEIEVKKKTRELERRNRQLDEMNMGMIEALATATEFRSEESGEHVRRIRKITELFPRGRGYRFPEYSSEDKNQIARASMLHDVGKIGVEDKILNKPGRLDEDEFEKMKQHTVLGYKDAGKYQAVEEFAILRICADNCPLPPRALGRPGLPRASGRR